ncbi:hypothetical protein LG52_1174 [Geobacillus kaustophilus]|uniref:Uncharacterized protein n=1 Tax=Geobacillus kaustophilus TaxID=1462 RepID=A0A0D8BR22_GEOKU|nr:hypothetical protein LG52_1174 [Geobacillus kaustophilus]
MPMKFIDELYEYYKDRLTGDEEDAEAVARCRFWMNSTAAMCSS